MGVRRFVCVLFLPLAVGLICSITSCGGSAASVVSSSNSTAVAPPTITVAVSPTTATVFTSLTQQFSATVAGTTNAAVTWSVNGVAGGNQTLGTISDIGLYTAPKLVPTPALLTVTATSASNTSVSGTAQLRVVTPIVVNLSPTELKLLPGQSQYFSAMVSGTTDSGVTWTVDGIVGGNSAVGTLVTTRTDPGSTTALYTAPAIPPVAQPLTVNAISTVDPAAFATARVFIPRDNQLPQGTSIKLGTSGGNASDLLLNGGSISGCCSGTLGSLLSRGGNFYILSNNHVLDKSDSGSVGDPIVQPGLGDVNCQAQNTATVAHMSQAATLHGSPSNVDAAMAAIVSGAVDTSGTILDLAAPGQSAPPSATAADAQTAFSSNEHVAKVGRSSGLTCSAITSVQTDLTVHYETSCGSSASFFDVGFTNQIVIGGSSFSEPGDSGSLVVTADTARPLGLLYAGNGTSTAVNPIQDVLSALKDPSTGELPHIVGSADHAVACPSASQSLTLESTQSAFAAELDAKAVQRAQTVKAQYETQIMQNSAVSSVSVGSSDDDPLQPAVVVHVRGPLQIPVPHQVGGIRTKVIFDQVQASAVLSKLEFIRAAEVKVRHSADLMSNSSVFGVGVGSSKDSPGESAIVIYIDRASAISIPIEIDGKRTQVVRTDPFRTSGWGKEVHSSCSTKSRDAGTVIHGLRADSR